jgi:hypothetical protein
MTILSAASRGSDGSDAQSESGVLHRVGDAPRVLKGRQFQAMATAFARHRGLVTADDVVARLRGRVDEPISSLARWIVGREIVNIVWQGQRHVPLLQFDLARMTIRPEFLRVVVELRCVFDDWELALWFIEPCAWMQGAVPIDRIDVNARDVHRAAMVDRFIACN